MDAYRAMHGKRRVHAACFTTSPERNHHWTSFSTNEYSMCLIFNKKIFLKSIDLLNISLIHDHVIYMSTTALRNIPSLPTEKMPFIKGIGYISEEEYRLILPPTDIGDEIVKIDFSISALDHILLAPNTPGYIERAVRAELKVQTEKGEIRIKRSVLPDDEDWKLAAGIW
jgi:hypothetical protein